MKPSDSILLRHALVWPAWNAEPVEDGAVLIEGDRIVKVGRFRARADTIVDAGGALAMPGFVQAHVHLCQTLFRGLAEERPLLRWLRERIWPLEAAHDEASLRASARLACAELIRGGTTSFASIETVRGTRAVLEAVAEIALPGLVGHCLMDDTCGYPPLAVDIGDALAECDVLMNAAAEHPWVGIAVAPRFALSCSEANLREAARYARSRGLRLHTHASEQPDEVAWIRQQTGMDNIAYLAACGLAGPDVMLAHGVQCDAAERARLAEAGTHVVHCPSSNFKLGSGIAPVPEMLAEGVPVALGADGAPCNNRLDIFQEMRLAGLAQTVRFGPGALSAARIVGMATEGGAAALGWGEVTGRLEAGRRADIVLIDLDDVSVLPDDSPASAVVYAGHPGTVAMTIAAGRILYENGEFPALDLAQLREDARQQRARLLRRANLA